MSLAARTSWMIERNLAGPLSLAGLAEANNVSRFHLAHAFGKATGRTVMRYVRGRRLSEAARTVAAGAPSILSCALDWGYGSNEAFTRAFQDQFGVAPEAVRASGTLEGLAIVAPLDVAARQQSPDAAPLTPRRETIADTWVFVGLPALVVFEEAATTVPGQWAQFMSRRGEVDDIADPVPWGVCRGVDEDGRLDYVCAFRVRHAKGDVPKGLVRVVVAPRGYAVFHHATHVSRLRETYEAIWNDWLPASGASLAEAPSLEQHCPTFDPRTGEGGVDIWMPLAG